MAKAFNLGEELRKAGGVLTVDTREQIEYIPLERIDPDPENFYSLDGLDELAGNIELVGLQQPLRVRDSERGHVIVVSGHRRRAAIMLIQDGGSDMFKGGVPCIREKPEATPEMQKLKLIFANSQTRVMSAPELSRQAVETRDLIAALRGKGFAFQGRTRELVASVLQTSDSRVGRLTAIREKLVPELLTQFDKGLIGETVAYRLSQETREMQSDIWRHCGISVQGISVDSVDFVIDQIKREQAPDNGRSGTPAPTIGEPVGADPQISPQPPDTGGPMRASAPTEKRGHEYSAIDGLKKYLDARHDENKRFWADMQEAADDLILKSFAAGALPMRKDNIDMLRLDCRSMGVCGYAADWQGSNKGISIGDIEKPQIERTWTEVYDALAAIAITRWRQVLVDERNQRNVKLKADVSTVDSEPKWRHGEPEDAGYYACWAEWVDPARGAASKFDPDYEILYWTGSIWTAHSAATKDAGYKVFGWMELPEEIWEEATT